MSVSLTNDVSDVLVNQDTCTWLTSCWISQGAGHVYIGLAEIPVHGHVAGCGATSEHGVD